MVWSREIEVNCPSQGKLLMRNSDTLFVDLLVCLPQQVHLKNYWNMLGLLMMSTFPQSSSCQRVSTRHSWRSVDPLLRKTGLSDKNHRRLHDVPATKFPFLTQLVSTKHTIDYIQSELMEHLEKYCASTSLSIGQTQAREAHTWSKRMK